MLKHVHCQHLYCGVTENYTVRVYSVYDVFLTLFFFSLKFYGTVIFIVSEKKPYFLFQNINTFIAGINLRDLVNTMKINKAKTQTLVESKV